MQAAEPTLLLSLRPAELPKDHQEWFAALQRRYVGAQLKIAMLIGTPLLADAGQPFCSHLASLVHVREPKIGTRLYDASDKPDCVYLLIRGTVELSVDAPPPPRGSPFVDRDRTSPAPVSYTHLTLPTICSV